MIDGIGATMQAGPTTAASTDAATMGKDDFLKLLVTQLSNQDPLNPQDGAEFVAQLAQFSSVEQLTNISSGMETLALAQQASTSAQMVGFIGRDVVSLGDSAHVSGGTTDVAFSLSGDASSAEVDLVDESGKKTTFTLDAEQIQAGTDGGATTLRFPPEGWTGPPLADGNYTAAVRAKDGAGEEVASQMRTTGRVVGVTFEAGYPELVLDGERRISLNDVIRVEESSDQASAPLLPLSPASLMMGEHPTLDVSAVPAQGQTALPAGLEDFIARRQGAGAFVPQGGVPNPLP